MELIQKYFPNLTKKQLQQLEQYRDLLVDWNGKVNLVSRKNEGAIEEQHILHSLAISKFANFQPNTRLIDLGTGGGLPGIPTAIVNPECTFHLVDSIGKKITAVQDMVDELGLENVTTEQVRVEKHKGKYDFVITRAVAQTGKLIAWSRHLFIEDNKNTLKNGIIALKGGDLTEELAGVERHHRLISLTDYFEEDFFETKKLLYIRMVK